MQGYKRKINTVDGDQSLLDGDGLKLPKKAATIRAITSTTEDISSNTKPVYRVSERSGIVKSDSCLHFGELSCEFDAVVGEGPHGNLISGCLAGKGDSQFVRKLFLLEEGDTGEEKKSQIHAVIKEWFFIKNYIPRRIYF